MLWIALTAHLSAPVPTNLKDWFGASDVPTFLEDRGTGLWWVGIKITVRPDGVVQNCGVETTSRIRDLDRLTCQVALARAKFIPARQSDGSPVYGVYRTSVKWVIADAPFDTSKLSNPDLELSVQGLPSGVKSPSIARVMFAVDEKGQMSSCIAEPTKTYENAENIPELVSVACEQLGEAFKPVPAKDSSGGLVPSVQDATVKFSVGKP
jgi:hypothetical protein